MGFNAMVSFPGRERTWPVGHSAAARSHRRRQKAASAIWRPPLPSEAPEHWLASAPAHPCRRLGSRQGHLRRHERGAANLVRGLFVRAVAPPRPFAPLAAGGPCPLAEGGRPASPVVPGVLRCARWWRRLEADASGTPPERREAGLCAGAATSPSCPAPLAAFGSPTLGPDVAGGTPRPASSLDSARDRHRPA